MLASEVIAPVAEVLQDQSNVTWTQAQLLNWLNDAQRTVALVRPDASAITGNITLQSGTKQALPTKGLRLLAVIRNMGKDGSTPGPVVRLVDRNTLDTATPNWHSAKGATLIREYVIDDRDPMTFWVSPPSDGKGKIEATYAVSPQKITTISDDVSIPSNYVPALIEWMLYRCFSRDSEQTPNYARAAGHFQAFFQLLGTKTQADLAVSPKVREHLR